VETAPGKACAAARANSRRREKVTWRL